LAARSERKRRTGFASGYVPRTDALDGGKLIDRGSLDPNPDQDARWRDARDETGELVCLAV
jgi:hypothetical protein